ncbi:MAG: tetratricopeptide repeat protein [Bacteroidetes bacterium]|nr:tetratricopeptide repeat protein [Bacteroidota bacterium]
MKYIFSGFLGLIITAIFFSLQGFGGDSSDKPVTNDTIVVGDSIQQQIVALTGKIADDPENADLYHERAKLFLLKSQIDEASEDMRKVISIDTTKIEYFITLTDVYFLTGRAGLAKAAIEKGLSIDPKNVDALLKVAELMLYFSDQRKCIEKVNEALTINKDAAKGYFLRGFALKELGDTAKAINDFQLTVDKDPEYYHAYIQLALLFSIKKNPLAVEYFDNALNLNPQSVEAWYGIGMYYQETGDYNKAFEAYNNLLAIDPNNKFAHYNMGFIHFQYLEVYAEAAKHFGNAILADSNYIEAIYMRGLSREKLGDLNNAEVDYHHALRLRENYDKALMGISRIEELKRK